MLFMPQALAARYSDSWNSDTQGSAATAGSPTVLIAVDATAQSACQETLHINIGWHTTPPPGAPPLVATTMTFPCPAGSIIKTAEAPLAQALAQHEAYVQMPANPQAPTVAERAALHALIDAKHRSLASGQSTTIQPLTACGAASWGVLQWYADYSPFFSRIHWYKNPACTQVFLDYAELDPGYFLSGENWSWNEDAYWSGSDVWEVTANGAGDLHENTTYSYYPNRWEPTNHWYDQWLIEYPQWKVWDGAVAQCN